MGHAKIKSKCMLVSLIFISNTPRRVCKLYTEPKINEFDKLCILDLKEKANKLQKYTKMKKIE